jgi:hypothetical protein
MIQIQFRLDIETGMGNVFSSSLSSPLLNAWEPLLSIALGDGWTNKVHGSSAEDLANTMDRCLQSFRDRNQYLSLADSQIALRPALEDYVEKLRDMCRANPRCTVTVLP